MSFAWFLLRSFAVVGGAFAEVTILAAHAGATLGKWEHIGATTLLSLPFLYEDHDGPSAPLADEDRRGRHVEAFHAACAVTYLALGIGSLVLALRGTHPRDLPLLLGAEALGALAVIPVLVRALLRLRRRPRPAPEAPFVGAYRTRPDRPIAPDRVIPFPLRARPPSSARARFASASLLLVCFALFLGGLLMWRFPHRPADAFWGPLVAMFFALCAWVHVEQLVAPGPMLSDGAGLRVLGALALASGLSIYLALGSRLAPAHERWLVVAGAAALLGISLFALARMVRRARWWRRRWR